MYLELLPLNWCTWAPIFLKSTLGCSLYKEKNKGKTSWTTNFYAFVKVSKTNPIQVRKRQTDNEKERSWILTELWWYHWEASQNHQRIETPLPQQNLGCSHLEAVEAAKTAHPKAPSLPPKTPENKNGQTNQEQNKKEKKNPNTTQSKQTHLKIIHKFQHFLFLTSRNKDFV